MSTKAKLKMGKWDPVKRIYEPYTVPEDWHVPLFCADLDEQINCARCGKNMTYGDAYTSRQIQGVFGLGYPVCIECNEIEWQEESKAKHESYKG